MKKTKLQFGLVLTLVGLGIVEAFSGFVLWLALPSGGGLGRRGIEQVFWTLSRYTWIDIHDWVAVALTAIIVIHLGLHWKWIFRMIRSFFTTLFGKHEAQPALLTGVAVPINTENKGGN
jgi:hypothetical protein